MAFVNADVIAQGLSGVAPNTVASEARRIMLERLHALAERCEHLALETTVTEILQPEAWTQIDQEAFRD